MNERDARMLGAMLTIYAIGIVGAVAIAVCNHYKWGTHVGEDRGAGGALRADVMRDAGH